jgi:two-component system OmpR family sensor kinase/two-component system sensor histidine kinase BaeS
LALPLLAVGLAVRAFRGIARPLADVMAATDAVAEGDLSVRVPVHGRGEFDRLAESFNRMIEELERADQQRRNLTADVAHELRTPLHIIQGNLEGILDDVYEPTEEHIGATLDETRLLARLVDDLRTLSLAESGQLPLVWEPVDVIELLADVGTSFSGQAEAAGIDLRVEASGDPSTMTVIGHRRCGTAGSSAGQSDSQRAAPHAPWWNHHAPSRACPEPLDFARDRLRRRACPRRRPHHRARHRRGHPRRGFALHF